MHPEINLSWLYLRQDRASAWEVDFFDYPDSPDLSRAGFDIAAEVAMWRRESKSGISFTELAERTAVNLSAFYREYLKRDVILSFHAEQQLHFDGRPGVKIVGKYEAWLSDLATHRERRGATRSALAELEDRLALASEGTIGVVTSPVGWSGLDDDYSESQTYVYRVSQGGRVEAITIRSNMSLEQNASLMTSLGANQDTQRDVTTTEKIRNIVSQVAIFEEAEKETGFQQVLSAIQDVMGGEILHVDEKGMRTFSEASQQIKEREQSLRIDNEVDSIIRLLVEHLSKLDMVARVDWEQARLYLEKTLLQIARYSFQNHFSQGTFVLIRREALQLSDYQVAEMLSQIGGCGGGGMSSRPGWSPGSPKPARHVGEDVLREEKLYECCGLMLKKGERCPICGAVI